MKRFATMVLFLMCVLPAGAVDFEVRKVNDFVVISRKQEITLLGTIAVRRSHIASVSVEKFGADYKLVIVTTPLISKDGVIASKTYETEPTDQRKTEAAFEQILKFLSEEAPAK